MLVQAELDAITDDEMEAGAQWLRGLVANAIERHHPCATPEWIAKVVLDEILLSGGAKEVPDCIGAACRGSVIRFARKPSAWRTRLDRVVDVQQANARKARLLRVMPPERRQPGRVGAAARWRRRHWLRRCARFPKDTEITTTHFGNTLAGRLQQLSKQVERLIPDRRDPERFFEERSEVACELREIADQMTLDKKFGG